MSPTRTSTSNASCPAPARPTASRRVVFWLIFIFFLFSAIGALKIPAVTTFMNQVLAYLPNIIAAIFIFVAAALIAGAIAAGIAKTMGDTPDRQDRGHDRARRSSWSSPCS